MPPVVIIGGSTASGKSGLALDIAQQRDGVIINADSIQMYGDLPILTAHPSQSDLKQCPHKLYGVLATDEKTDVQKWRTMAILECRKAHKESKLPIIVGGTGFYLKSMIEGLSPIPQTPIEIRDMAEMRLKELGIDAFRTETLEFDPTIEHKIDLDNPMRLMRAWSVYKATGKPLSTWQSLPKEGAPDGFDFTIITLRPDREALYQRCNARFKTMFETGALAEVKDLKTRIENGDAPQDAPVTRAIGYTELSNYIDGRLKQDEVIDIASQATRNYAKRQTTFFKNQFKADIIVQDVAGFDLTII